MTARAEALLKEIRTLPILDVQELARQIGQIVPELPVTSTVSDSASVQTSASSRQEEINRKLAAIERLSQSGVNVGIPDEMLRRENMYGDDGR